MISCSNSIAYTFPRALTHKHTVIDTHAHKYSSNKKTGNMPPFQFQHGAWATTDDITCQEPQNCLGCCFNYPYRGDCSTCDTKRNLVIKCGKYQPETVKIQLLSPPQLSLTSF